MMHHIKQLKMAVCALAIAAAALLGGCSQNERTNYSLKLHITGFDDTTGIFLDELRSKYVHFDTATYVKDGNFVFDNKIDKTSFFRLRVGTEHSLLMILTPGQTTTIVSDLKNLSTNPTIIDNDATQAMLRSQQLAADYQADLKRIVSVFNDTTRARPLLAEKDSLVSLSDTLHATRKKQMMTLLDASKNSLAQLPILLQRCGNHEFFSPKTDRQLFADVDNYLIRNYGYQAQVRSFHYRLDSAFAAIDSLNGARIGDLMPEPSGKTIWKERLPIGKFKGRTVLVFVWSSYDDACQQDLPTIKRLWETYNKKGLDVFMISTDSTETIWRNAIDQYRLACFHVNDLQGSKSPVFKELGLRGIPANFVINKEGVIIEKNIWGQILEEAIKNQIGK